MNWQISLIFFLAIPGVFLPRFEDDSVVVVSHDVLTNPRQPQAAVDETGTIHVAFGAGDNIYCCTSRNVGKSFGEPVEVGSLSKLALGMRRGPRMAAGKGSVVITAISHDSGDVLAWRSTDDAKSWQGPVRVNDSPTDAREGLHAMSMGPDGQLYCTWLDLRNGKTQLFGASSINGGQTWSENRMIYRSPDGSICECCHPAVTHDGNGTIYVMWRNSLGGCRDMFVAESDDGGQSFSEARNLGVDNWKLDACPMDGGYLASAKPGEFTTIWRRNKQVFRTDSVQTGEQLLGNGEQPWSAATPNGVYLVWLSRRNGDLWLSKPDDPEPVKLSGSANDPIVATPFQRNGPVVVVWETGSKPDTAIRAVVVHE